MSTLKFVCKAVALVALLVGFAIPSQAQIWKFKKKQDRANTTTMSTKAQKGYTYTTGSRRYNAEKGHYDYKDAGWSKKPNVNRHNPLAFSKAKYGIKAPKKGKSTTPADDSGMASATTNKKSRTKAPSETGE